MSGPRGALPNATKQPKAGLSLYANLLLDKSASAESSAQSISRAPVIFGGGSDGGQQDELAAKQNAALRFQPRPRQSTSVPKPQFGGAAAAATAATTAHSSSAPSAPAAKSTAVLPSKFTIADWAGDDDDLNGLYVGEKRQRGGRKKRKKYKEEAMVALQDWDDIYDPSRPNVYDEYRTGEERCRETREWKDKLYAHRIGRRAGVDLDDSESGDDGARGRPAMNAAFAPPPSYSFAPPHTLQGDGNDAARSEANQVGGTSPIDSQQHDSSRQANARLPEQSPSSAAPPASSSRQPSPTRQSPDPSIVGRPAATISREPVRYQMSDAALDTTSKDEHPNPDHVRPERQDDEDTDAAEKAPDEDTPRSLRPGQKGFAQRLMSKYGWTKGSGLGASGTGIVKPLRVEVEKRKKKSDAEGGGWAGPAGKGKIIASKYGKGTAPEEGQKETAPSISEVIILDGMLDGLDLEHELGEGNLMQEIGEECGDKYGRVERLFIHRDSTLQSIPVFIKFTSQLSALRAVQALNGRIFNGNTIRAGYYDADKFQNGEYE